jgi:hypothetical protein
MEDVPTHCRFSHPGFAAFGKPVFRLTKDDRVAALTVSVDSGDVVVPLSSVARLFGIRPGSTDAQMLHYVEQSLRFLPSLQLGDKLPSEILTGEASWEPSVLHRQVASARLQLQLVKWIGGIADADDSRATSQMVIASVDDPVLRSRITEALRRAADELGVTDGQAVAAMVEELAAELSYIEALRERLFERAKEIARRLIVANHDQSSLASGRRETLFQVTRLATTALGQIAARFAEIDAQSSEILPALRNLDQQRNFLRPERDRLYCTLLVWEPILSMWETLPANHLREPEGFWRVIDESYRFLAPRYMTVQEWQTALASTNRAERGKTTLVW